MFRNYLKSAWRNMMRSKLYTLINIFCLTVGISGAIIIALYLNHELSYDTHHENHRSIYRIEGVYTIGGSDNHLAITPFPLGQALKLDFSDIKEYVRFFSQEDLVVRIDDREFLEQDFVFTDSTLFNVFTHRFIYGGPQGALAEPNTAVLSLTVSRKFFGEEDPVGKTFEANGQTYMVHGVVEDLPENTHMWYNGMLAMHSGDNQFAYSLDPQLFWNINMNYTYVQLHEGADMESVFGDMEAFNEKYIDPVGGFIGGTMEFLFTPLRDTHFTTVQLAPRTGNKTTLLIFAVVAVFLVVIAAVNYTNLATARASKRAREIGLRKVSGATRGQMVTQFLSESILVAVISLLISLLVVELLLPGFNTLADKNLSLGHLFDGKIFIQVVLITLATGVISGIYPAFFLSRMEPAEAMKANQSNKGGSARLRKALVVFQFVISVVLIAGTITVEKQLRFLQDKDMGFTTENRMVVTFQARDARDRIETIENTIRQNPSVVSTTKGTAIPGLGANLHAVKVEMEGEMADGTISSYHVDHDFLDMMGIELLEGRSFDRELRADVNSAILVNEAAVRRFGWHDDPIGKRIQWNFNEEGVPQTTLQVVGVVKDFNFLTLENPIDPLMLLLPENTFFYRAIFVEYLPGRENEVTAFLEETARTFEPARLPSVNPLNYGFRNQFESEEKLGRIFRIFALVCIIISFLGLFGLSSFTTEQRKKEIGVRKVLGSSGWSILWLFYKDFSILVLIASVIAAPVAWLAMSRWLEGFTYQIDMGLGPILLSALLSMAIAVLTVSYHTFMAARMNPVDAIRAQ
jgi:putative ABC transport system permease protein